MPEYTVAAGCRIIHHGTAAEAGQTITMAADRAGPLLADGRLTTGATARKELPQDGPQEQAQAGKPRRSPAGEGGGG